MSECRRCTCSVDFADLADGDPLARDTASGVFDRKSGSDDELTDASLFLVSSRVGRLAGIGRGRGVPGDEGSSAFVSSACFEDDETCLTARLLCLSSPGWAGLGLLVLVCPPAIV